MSNVYDYSKPNKRAQEKAKFRDMKPRQRGWSHQDELSGLVGKRVHIRTTADETWTGKLLAADQFTLKIEGASGLASPSVAVIFKSAVIYFREAN